MIFAPGVPEQDLEETTADYLSRLSVEQLVELRGAVASARASISDKEKPRSPYQSSAYRGLRYEQRLHWIDEELEARKRCKS